MEKIDYAIAGAGAVVLVVAVAASAFYGSGLGGGALTFDLKYPTSATKLETKTFTTSAPAAQDYTFNVTVANLTEIAFSATATPNTPTTPGGESVQIKVTPPIGAGNATTFTGTLSAKGSISLAKAPAEKTVNTNSADAAHAQYAAPSALGKGTWKVQVIFETGNPLPVSPVSYTVSLETTATSWAGSAEQVLPASGR
ncbi:MAG: hypothetical protein ACYDCK_06910 [Thermoplasmatota archaeon]